MESTTGDEIYSGWIDKWRKWKHAWFDSNEPIMVFFVRFISKDGKYSNEEHADLSSMISSTIPSCRIKRNGTLSIQNENGSGVCGEIQIVSNNKKCYTDRFGIVSLKFDMCIRRDILTTVKAIERMGHGVLHDGGKIISSDYNDFPGRPRKLPMRDDPIWDL